MRINDEWGLDREALERRLGKGAKVALLELDAEGVVGRQGAARPLRAGAGALRAARRGPARPRASPPRARALPDVGARARADRPVRFDGVARTDHPAGEIGRADCRSRIAGGALRAASGGGRARCSTPARCRVVSMKCSCSGRRSARRRRRGRATRRARRSRRCRSGCGRPARARARPAGRPARGGATRSGRRGGCPPSRLRPIRVHSRISGITETLLVVAERQIVARALEAVTNGVEPGDVLVVQVAGRARRRRTSTRARTVTLPQFGHSGIWSRACSATWKPQLGTETNPLRRVCRSSTSPTAPPRLPANVRPCRRHISKRWATSGSLRTCEDSNYRNREIRSGSPWTGRRNARKYRPFFATARHEAPATGVKVGGSRAAYNRATACAPIAVSRTIDAPRERVFEYLSNIANHAEFSDHYLHDFRLERLDSSGLGASAS